MSLASMTGFGRAEGSDAAVAWVWEVRSVNGRSLDVRMRLPPGFEALEPRVRELLQRRLARGSINLTLGIRRTSTASTLRVDAEALAVVVQAAELAHRHLKLDSRLDSRIDVAGLLGLRGVLLADDPVESDATAEARALAILATLEQAVDAVITARRAEGGRLATVIATQLDQVEALVGDIQRAPSRRPEQVTARLRTQIDRLLGAAGAPLDPARQHQEAVLHATRIDVEEELKRLTAHVAAARDLLAAREPAGRQLDFLTQEFNREANTLCSKGNDLDVTRPGLALKAVIDQMREQVQNIE
jgi:uncharacterized protein (TIGR00255 family)